MTNYLNEQSSYTTEWCVDIWITIRTSPLSVFNSFRDKILRNTLFVINDQFNHPEATVYCAEVFFNLQNLREKAKHENINWNNKIKSKVNAKENKTLKNNIFKVNYKKKVSRFFKYSGWVTYLWRKQQNSSTSRNMEDYKQKTEHLKKWGNVKCWSLEK
jgi:hypothetical protein